jgi:hypothetical protein
MHYNIQINVQQVGYEDGTTVPRRGQTNTAPRKTVVEMLSLKVVASTEEEAYAKATKMLEAATPDFESKKIDPADVPDEEDEDEF